MEHFDAFEINGEYIIGDMKLFARCEHCDSAKWLTINPSHETICNKCRHFLDLIDRVKIIKLYKMQDKSSKDIFYSTFEMLENDKVKDLDDGEFYLLPKKFYIGRTCTDEEMIFHEKSIHASTIIYVKEKDLPALSYTKESFSCCQTLEVIKEK